MKPRNRDINIFSMSALDLFASALGAFILISIALFPYFPRTGWAPEDISALREALAEAEQQLQQCQSELDRTRGALAEAERERDGMRDALQSCEQELRKKFLLALISWGTRDDVDLHVVDPAGNEFYYQQRDHSGTPARLEEDNTRGPGNEVWLHPQATPGEYRLYYRLFDKRSGGVTVRGAILTPEGRQAMPDIRLTRQGEKPLVAIVTVDNNGNATLRAAP